MYASLSRGRSDIMGVSILALRSKQIVHLDTINHQDFLNLKFDAVAGSTPSRNSLTGCIALHKFFQEQSK